MTTAAGFFLASRLHIHWALLSALGGLALVIASAGVFNNYLDKDIDKKMARTRGRALASGRIVPAKALIYASVLGAGGFLILGIFTNRLVLGLAAAALVFYVVIYGAAKRRTVHSTLIGSLPGAVPPAAGYLAVTGRLDGGALLVFLILVFWQMPHFYAIAMYRFKDYQAAGLPVLTVRSGMAAARIQIMAYIVLFTIAAALLTVFGYTGYIYLAAILLLGIYWFATGLKSYRLKDKDWGRKMFIASLKVTVVLSLAIAAGSALA